MFYLQVAPLTFHKQNNYKQAYKSMLHTHVASKNKNMNEMNDAHAYEMQCN
jgi:hypothetical protein